MIRKLKKSALLAMTNFKKRKWTVSSRNYIPVSDSPFDTISVKFFYEP